MKTPEEIIKELAINIIPGSNISSTMFIARCMTDYAKLVQEEQIKLCAYDFTKGTIGEGGEDVFIKDSPRVL